MIPEPFRPTENTKEAWLFPIIAAPWRKINETKRYYKNIIGPFQASYIPELLNLPALQCACASLCCDKITALIEGEWILDLSENLANQIEAINQDKKKEKTDIKLYAKMLDNEHDFGNRLFLIANNGATLKINVQLNHYYEPDDTDESTPESIVAAAIRKINMELQIIAQAKGIIFSGFNFEINIDITLVSYFTNLLSYKLGAIATCVACDSSSFINCTSTINANISVLNFPIEKEDEEDKDDYQLPPEETDTDYSKWIIGGGGYIDNKHDYKDREGKRPDDDDYNTDKDKDENNEDKEDKEADKIPDYDEIEEKTDINFNALGFINATGGYLYADHVNISTDISSIIGANINATAFSGNKTQLFQAPSASIMAIGKIFPEQDKDGNIDAFAFVQSTLAKNNQQAPIQELAGYAKASAIISPIFSDEKPEQTNYKGAAIAIANGAIYNPADVIDLEPVLDTEAEYNKYATKETPCLNNGINSTCSNDGAICSSNIYNWCLNN